MKKLLTILLFFSCVICKAQDSVMTNIPDTAKLTLSKVYSDVKSGIQGLAQALKVPANHVYSILVKQQTSNAIAYLTLILIFVIFSIVTYRLSRANYKAHLKYCKESQGDDDPDIGDSSFSVVAVILSIISGITFITSVVQITCYYNQIIIGFINPEYGAIKEIMSFIK